MEYYSRFLEKNSETGLLNLIIIRIFIYKAVIYFEKIISIFFNINFNKFILINQVFVQLISTKQTSHQYFNKIQFLPMFPKIIILLER